MLNKFQPDLKEEIKVRLTEFLSTDSKKMNKKYKCCRNKCWNKFTYAEIEENILEF